MKKTVRWTWYSFLGILAIGWLGFLFYGLPYWVSKKTGEPHTEWAGLIAVGGVIGIIVGGVIIILIANKIHDWAWDE